MGIFEDLGAEQERLEKILLGLDEAQWTSASGPLGVEFADTDRLRQVAWLRTARCHTRPPKRIADVGVHRGSRVRPRRAGGGGGGGDGQRHTSL
jgi:hypothetical protein